MKFDTKIPISIDPCPIHEAILEIRFSPNIHKSAVFGIIYSNLKEEFPVVNKLPIIDLPDKFRENEPELEYKPYYRLVKENYIIQIGPKVFSVSVTENYPGWREYSEKILKWLRKIKNPDLFENVTRLGLRYINFFDYDIFDKTKISIKVGNEELNADKTFMKAEIGRKSYLNNLVISNNASRILNNKQYSGSIIDIDTFTNEPIDNFFSNMKDNINEEHNVEKEIFFNILTTEFINSLNPVYD